MPSVFDRHDIGDKVFRGSAAFDQTLLPARAVRQRARGEVADSVQSAKRGMDAEYPIHGIVKSVVESASGQHPRQARWSAAKRSGSNGGLGLDFFQF